MADIAAEKPGGKAVLASDEPEAAEDIGEEAMPAPDVDRVRIGRGGDVKVLG